MSSPSAPELCLENPGFGQRPMQMAPFLFFWENHAKQVPIGLNFIADDQHDDYAAF